MNKNLLRLTDGERLWLARRRIGIPQDIAARRFDIGEKIYAAIESDDVETTLFAQKNLYRVQKTLRRKGAPSLRDKLILARRRAAIGLAETAKALAVSRVTLLAMERRGDPGLVAFWKKRGFRF